MCIVGFWHPGPIYAVHPYFNFPFMLFGIHNSLSLNLIFDSRTTLVNVHRLDLAVESVPHCMGSVKALRSVTVIIWGIEINVEIYLL